MQPPSTFDTMRIVLSCFVVSIGAALVGMPSAHAHAELKVDLAGEISNYCEVESVSTPVVRGNLIRGGKARVSFDVNCNSSMQGSIRLKNGSLKHYQANENGWTGALSLVPIKVSGFLGKRKIFRDKNGADFIGGFDFSTGKKVVGASAVFVTLQWDPAPRTYGGQYSETIELLIEPKL